MASLITINPLVPPILGSDYDAINFYAGNAVLTIPAGIFISSVLLQSSNNQVFIIED
ncbi:hypothetical protein [Polynucleobacter parvulilacunae]|uniref:hypothetical protein n=1 Tax=Polynucleobacter parvulilacunae TaxID=1855631 RepID=UPI001C0C873E|nr:hypothetical protein [Polynucleobacter parvulilacunae]